jgi:hypothetical protein
LAESSGIHVFDERHLDRFAALVAPHESDAEQGVRKLAPLALLNPRGTALFTDAADHDVSVHVQG